MNKTFKTKKRTINECIREHILDQEVCNVQRDMYDFFSEVFLKNIYKSKTFICLDNKQTNRAFNLIKKHFENYTRRIEQNSEINNV
ncbi:MAG: hypothetical protein H8E55_53955 [Pelagibacterales bacterium]|nr:hypothetical protein [Pelagibacterales bacterium]